jgi:hypothetical protein
VPASVSAPRALRVSQSEFRVRYIYTALGILCAWKAGHFHNVGPIQTPPYTTIAVSQPEPCSESFNCEAANLCDSPKFYPGPFADVLMLVPFEGSLTSLVHLPLFTSKYQWRFAVQLRVFNAITTNCIRHTRIGRRTKVRGFKDLRG